MYPGAPHGFFDRHFDEHADDSADAWNRTLTFIRHTMGQPIAGSSAGRGARDARGPGAPRAEQAQRERSSDPRVDFWADQVRGEDD